MNKKGNLQVYFIIICVIMVIGAAIFAYIRYDILVETQLEQNICIAQNYSKLTDKNKLNSEGDQFTSIKVYQIECDNKVLKNQYELITSTTTSCIKRDKWNTCIKTKSNYKYEVNEFDAYHYCARWG